MTEIIDGVPQPVNVGDKYVKATWFSTAASGTVSGTITHPAGDKPEVAFIMDEWGTDSDALVSKMANGKPTFESPVNAGGDTITTTFNLAGEYAFSGTPSPAGDHAIIYVYKCYLKHFNVAEALFESELVDFEAAGSIATHAAIQATASVQGHATAVQITKLDAIEALADVTSTNETSHADVLVDGDIGVSVQAYNADITTLVNDSMADTLHRHSELSASDGTPNPALSVNATGLVGIGVTDQQNNLTVVASSDVSGIQIHRLSNTGIAGLGFRSATGSSSSAEMAKISAIRTNDPENVYTDMIFSVYGQAGVVQKMRIKPSGNIVIGVVTPLAKLHVDQPLGVGAIPVLYLNQADVSEEMIEFNTTIGVGNAIEAIGAKTLTTTHFIKVTLPGALTCYIPCGTIA